MMILALLLHKSLSLDQVLDDKTLYVIAFDYCYDRIMAFLGWAVVSSRKTLDLGQKGGNIEGNPPKQWI